MLKTGRRGFLEGQYGGNTDRLSAMFCVASACSLFLNADDAFCAQFFNCQSAEAGVKTDKLDSKALAHLLRADLIAECYVPSRDVRLSRALLSHRVNITREQTRIKNRIHSLLDKYDLECEHDDIFGAHGMRWLHALQLNGHDHEIFQSLLRELIFLQGEEDEANSTIAKDASSHMKLRASDQTVRASDWTAAWVLLATNNMLQLEE